MWLGFKTKGEADAIVDGIKWKSVGIRESIIFSRLTKSENLSQTHFVTIV